MKVQKDSGKFLTADEVDDQEFATILNEGEETEGQFGTRLQIGLKIASGQEKILTLNPTSKNAIIDAYGDDTSDWVGKEVRIHVIRTLVSGKTKQVIYLTHPNKDLEGKNINE